MIIVALPKIEDAKRVRRVLLSHGYDNVVSCGTGAAALMEANNENRGLIICAARLPDMHYSELLEYMPRFYELLLLGSGSAVSDAGGDVMALTIAAEDPRPHQYGGNAPRPGGPPVQKREEKETAGAE